MITRTILASVCMIAFSSAMFSCEKEAVPATSIRPVRTTRIVAEGSVEGRQFPGRAEPTQQVNLSFRVAGTVSAFQVSVGDEVEAGQTVAELDTRDFEVSIRNAEADLSMFKADVAVAEEEFQRTQAVFEGGAASEFELTSKREARNAAIARVAAAEAGLEAAQDSLKYATIVAPFKGQVTATYVEAFEDVQAKEAVARILDDSRIEMVIFVPEHLISAAPTANQIRCEFDAFPGLVLDAQLKEISTEADATTRTYPVTLIMDQPPSARILPGMAGKAWAMRPQSAESEERGLMVPTTALGEETDGARFVWIVDEQSGTVSRRGVEVGEIAVGGVYLQGLVEGELIVTAGVSLLAEGQRVRVESTAPAEGGQ